VVWCGLGFGWVWCGRGCKAGSRGIEKAKQKEKQPKEGRKSTFTIVPGSHTDLTHLHRVGDLLHHVERHVVAQPRVLVDQRIGARCFALRL